jgi:hypothetical protein
MPVQADIFESIDLRLLTSSGNKNRSASFSTAIVFKSIPKRPPLGVNTKKKIQMYIVEGTIASTYIII